GPRVSGAPCDVAAAAVSDDDDRLRRPVDLGDDGVDPVGHAEFPALGGGCAEAGKRERRRLGAGVSPGGDDGAARSGIEPEARDEDDLHGPDPTPGAGHRGLARRSGQGRSGMTSRRSTGPTTTSACARTAGFALNATPNPATDIICRSFAP